MSSPYIGQIRMFAGNFAPRDHAFCDGTLLQVAQHTALFSLLGTIYGGDGRTTFGLPDLRGRAPMHWGRGPGLTPRTIGQNVGSETATLAESQMPAHGHGLVGVVDAPVSSVPAANRALATATVYAPMASADAQLDPATIGSAGAGQAHTNMQAFNTIHFIIALQGVFPSRN
jgi:microcystin-dependent protein